MLQVFLFSGLNIVDVSTLSCERSLSTTVAMAILSHSVCITDSNTQNQLKKIIKIENESKILKTYIKN